VDVASNDRGLSSLSSDNVELRTKSMGTWATRPNSSWAHPARGVDPDGGRHQLRGGEPTGDGNDGPLWHDVAIVGDCDLGGHGRAE